MKAVCASRGFPFCIPRQCLLRANNGRAVGGSDAEHALVREQSGCSASMDENNICVRLPSHLPNKRYQTSQSLARVDWINGQGFQRSGKLDGLDGCRMRLAIGGTSEPGDDLDIILIEGGADQIGC